jgi:hypothetical protein
MILQLAHGYHLKCYQGRAGFLWLRKVRRWSLYKAIPVALEGGIVADFEPVYEGLSDDDMHLHLIAMARPPADLALFVEALGDRPYRDQAPLDKVRRVHDEVRAIGNRAA